MVSLAIILFELRRAFNKSSQLKEAYENRDKDAKNKIKARLNASAVYKTVISFFQMVLIIKSLNFSWQSEYSTIIGYFTFSQSVESSKCFLEYLGI